MKSHLEVFMPQKSCSTINFDAEIVELGHNTQKQQMNNDYILLINPMDVTNKCLSVGSINIERKLSIDCQLLYLQKICLTRRLFHLYINHKIELSMPHISSKTFTSRAAIHLTILMLRPCNHTVHFEITVKSQHFVK